MMMTEQPGCPSELALDRLVVGELVGSEEASLQKHVEGCASCTERVADRQRCIARFADDVPLDRTIAATLDRTTATTAATLDRTTATTAATLDPTIATSRDRTSAATSPRVRRRRTWPYAVASAAVASAALAVAIFVVPRAGDTSLSSTSRRSGDTPTPPSGEQDGVRRKDGLPGDEDVIRRKGGLGLKVIARRGGTTSYVTSPASLAPGDAIAFAITSERAGYLGIVGIDAAGVVTPYVPAASAAAQPLAAGVDIRLDGSIVLDDTRGFERIVAVLCDDTFEMDALVARARSALAAAGGDPSRVELEASAGCRQATFLVDKTLGGP